MRLQSKQRVFDSAAKAAAAKDPKAKRERVYEVTDERSGDTIWVLERTYHHARSRAAEHWGIKAKQIRLSARSRAAVAEAFMSLPDRERRLLLAELYKAAQ